MNRGTGVAASANRQSSRLEATESLRVLDEQARVRRAHKALANLEQDNFFEDPHAHLQVHKKRPKFEDHEVPSAGLAQATSAKKKAPSTEERSAIKKRRLMHSDHFKQRFRKTFAVLLEEENANNKEYPQEHGAYERAAAPAPVKPPRKFCSVCGFFSKYTCVRCGGKYCSIRCRDVHIETRCMKWTV